MDPLSMPLDALVSKSRKEHKKKVQKKKVGGIDFFLFLYFERRTSSKRST